MSLKSPVDSTTMSTPSSFQGSCAGSLIAHTRTSRPSTKMASSLALTSAGSAPCTESCLRRWARVLASARSFTPTISMSLAPSAVRKNTRPMRPKPLTPTRILMKGLLVKIQRPSGCCDHSKVYGHLQDTSNRDHANAAGAGCPQGAGAFADGSAGGDDIVDQDHVA